MFYALAVSFLLVLLIGGPLAIKHWTQGPTVITASLDLDQGLKDILLEDDTLKWEKKERLNRLLAALQQRGLAVKELNLALLSKPYYQKKSLFGPKEVLRGIDLTVGTGESMVIIGGSGTGKSVLLVEYRPYRGGCGRC